MHINCYSFGPLAGRHVSTCYFRSCLEESRFCKRQNVQKTIAGRLDELVVYFSNNFGEPDQICRNDKLKNSRKFLHVGDGMGSKQSTTFGYQGLTSRKLQCILRVRGLERAIMKDFWRVAKCTQRP